MGMCTPPRKSQREIMALSGGGRKSTAVAAEHSNISTREVEHAHSSSFKASIQAKATYLGSYPRFRLLHGSTPGQKVSQRGLLRVAHHGAPSAPRLPPHPAHGICIRSLALKSF